MHTLRDVELDAAAELDPTGGGFETSALAKAIFDAVKDENGALTANAHQLMREGASRRAGRFQAPYKRLGRKLAKNSQQRDMLELDTGFAFLIQRWIGLDETDKAIRKPIMKMNLAEFETAIALHERKAEETAAKADAMRKLLLNNPTWRRQPKLTLERLLEIVLVEDQLSPGAQPPPDQPGAAA